MGKEELGDFLRQESQKRGLALRQLSMGAGLSQATVGNIINRRNWPSLDSLNKLADYLGIKRQYLWQLAGLVDSIDTDFNDARLRYCFDRVDKLPDSARTLAIRLIDSVVVFLEYSRRY